MGHETARTSIRAPGHRVTLDLVSCLGKGEKKHDGEWRDSFCVRNFHSGGVRQLPAQEGSGDLLGIRLRRARRRADRPLRHGLSHAHGDHTGGLASFLAENPEVEVYMPRSFTPAFKSKVRASGWWLLGPCGPQPHDWSYPFTTVRVWALRRAEESPGDQGT